jgi:RNA polymerase sigma factor (sigma-70 family)
MDLIDNDTLARNVSSARGGNRAALEAVVRAIEPFVGRLALRFFGCPRYAQDATQEALVHIVVKLDRFDTQSAFSTWAYRVAINKFLSMARSPKSRCHLNPSNLVFASSVEQVRRFSEVLTHIREIEEVQRAAEIYRCHPDPTSRRSFVDQLQHLLDAGSRVIDQG